MAPRWWTHFCLDRLIPFRAFVPCVRFINVAASISGCVYFSLDGFRPTSLDEEVNWVSRVHEIMIHASSCSNPLKVRGQNKGWWGGGGSDVSTQPLVNSPRFIMANFYTVACTVCLSNLARHVAAAFRLYFIVSDKLVRSCTPLNHEFPTYSSSKVSRRRLVA